MNSRIGQLNFARLCCWIWQLLAVWVSQQGVTAAEILTPQLLSNPATPPFLDVATYAGVTITGVVGKSYALLATSALASNAWQKVGAVVLTNSVQLWIDFDSPNAGKRFYRAVDEATIPPIPGLVWIEPGVFTMGSPVTEIDRFTDEGPQKEVEITDGFWIAKYELTQAEYQAVIGSNPSKFKGNVNRPVELVTWHDATNYCAKFTEQERAAGRVPAGYVYRLPTEAEWEYAARAGSTTRFSYGDDPGYTNLVAYAWFQANSSGSTHPVGRKLPNPWGLYDLAGNVHEWCLDWFRPYERGAVGQLTHRILRGGSWSDEPTVCRSASRNGLPPSSSDSLVGFRVVLGRNPP